MNRLFSNGKFSYLEDLSIWAICQFGRPTHSIRPNAPSVCVEKFFLNNKNVHAYQHVICVAVYKAIKFISKQHIQTEHPEAHIYKFDLCEYLHYICDRYKFVARIYCIYDYNDWK